MRKKLLAILLVISMVLAMMPVAFAADTDVVLADLKGKKVSVIGDSISTLSGVSDNANYNPTIANSEVFYSEYGIVYGIEQHDTWWQQAIDALGMELCVNNSWSGSRFSQDGSGPAAYKDRCVQLHNVYGEEPDYIWVYLGTNDYSYHNLPWGSAADVNKDTLFVQGEDGVYNYPEPATVCEAYAIMLHKSMVRYPDAEIYCLGLLTRDRVDAGLSAANDELEAVAALLGITFVELESITANAGDYHICMGDALHPNEEGMDRIAQRVINAVLGKEDQRELNVYDVTNKLMDVATSNKAMLSFEGGSYEAILSTAGDYTIHAKVLMGGVDVTAACYKNGRIFIPDVTGDIIVIASVDLGEKTQAEVNNAFDKANTAAANMSSIVEMTTAAVITVCDVIATVAADIPNIAKTVVNEVNSFACMVSEWSGNILNFLENLL